MLVPGKTAQFPANDSDMARKIRALDWSTTPLGPIDAWPAGVRIAVDMALSSQLPICLFFGPDLIAIFNDAYVPLIGSKSRSLGEAYAVTYAEVWDTLGPIALSALNGEPVFFEDHPIPLDRFGQVETGYFTFSYSPLRDETGAIIGIIDCVVETTSKVLAQRELARQREQLTELFEQAPTFMALVGGETHVFEYANPQYRRLVADRDILGRSVGEALPETIPQGFVALLDQVFRTGEPFTATGARVDLLSNETGQLEERFLDFVYQPIRDGKGDVTGIFVEGADVTARVQGERRTQALVRLSDLIRDAETIADLSYATGQVIGETLQVSRVGYGTVNPLTDDLTVERDWNADGVQSLAGVLNLRDFGSFVDDIKAGHFTVIADVREDPRTARAAAALEARHARSFVNFPIVEDERTVAVLYINHAQVRHWSHEDLTFFKEIGERTRTAVERIRATDNVRQTQAELRELNEQLEARVADALAERKVFSDVIDGSTAAVTALDLNFRILAINKSNVDAFEQVYGKRPRIGDDFLDLFADLPDHVEQQRGIWSRALAGEEFFIIQAFGDNKFDRRYYEVRFSTLRDGDGRPVGASSTSYDVTDRVHAEEQLGQAQEQLRQAQKMEAVGQLTGGIAHDFNNMLAVVTGSLDLLERRTPAEDGRARRLISSAQEASKRAANLTRRLLAFSRQQPLEPEVLDVNKLVSGMSDLFRHSLGADIRLETVLAGGVWPAFIDPNQLESVLLNLAVNARDAMPGGGHLTIETQNTHLDARYVMDELGVAPGQYVMIAVTDTGSGMPADVIAKAFDPFFTTKEVGKGTGLGLSQVYGFIKQSGGNVKIYSEVAQGTTVKIYLPRHHGPSGPGDGLGDAQEPPEAESRELILVVDDEEIVRTFSVEALTELGYGVVSAASAAEALGLIAERPDIDLLFTDIVMPETNGRKLADAVAALRPELPVLYTTGYTRNAIVHNGILDAGVDLIGKPFTIDELAIKVREVLDTALLKAKAKGSSPA